NYLASDGLHPSGKRYAEWVELILPVAKKILSQ
ncbi:MAG: SGNH/GDSL hydrolase family protein, partial [candidate division KSB1 bacterium]|nr:SGNH/GDSL hydrolase family protein [candidate division KSB1 bacterium]